MTTLQRQAAGWAVTTLGDVVDVLDGRRVPVNASQRATRQGSVPYYGATGQVGWIDAALFDEDLVLLGEDGAPFLDPARPKAYAVRGRSWVNNHAHVLRAKSGVLNSFLLHQLNAIDYRPYVSGTTRLKLPQGPMRRIRLVVPSIELQKRLVDEIEKQLTRLDAAVAALRRVQAQLKRYRAAVLKAACEGRLVATEAESCRRDGTTYVSGADLVDRMRAVRQSQDEHGSANRAQAAQERANHSPLPDGWAWTTLDACSDVKGGITKDQKRRHSRPARLVPYLRVANVQRGYLDLNEVKAIEASETDIEQLSLRVGDVLFNEGGDRDKLGRGWIWNGELPECIHQNHVFRARLLSEELHPKFVSWYANTEGQQFFFDQGKHTTNLASISMSKLKRLPIPVPPPAEQRRIVAEVERRFSVVEETEATVAANLQRASRLRQSILDRAFRGELVRGATTA